jgi:hypothetical protein
MKLGIASRFDELTAPAPRAVNASDLLECFAPGNPARNTPICPPGDECAMISSQPFVPPAWRR